jgi:hypothetical protein
VLSLTVPIEGVEGRSFSPPEVLTARLDVWEARVGSLHRELLSAATREQARAADVVESGRLMKAQGQSLPAEFQGHRPLCVERAWPEEDTGIDPVEHATKKWMSDAETKLAEADRQEKIARAATAVEHSICVVSNAVTALQSVQPSDDPGDGTDAAASQNLVRPTCEIQALVELGRLQLERARQLEAPDTPGKWEQPVPDPREMRGMELGERYSMVVQSKDPSELFKLSAEAQADAEASAEASSCTELPFEDMGKRSLCEATQKALAARQFPSARRALQALALDAYGVQCPEASFEFLIWLQSVDVCMRAEDIYGELVEDDHQERVQMSLLYRLANTWFDPSQLTAYEASMKRLCKDSPFFQRLRIADLPPISELLLSYVPPLTLVVTLQLHDDYLYVGAACSPPDGADPQQRLPQIKHMVTRMRVVASELNAYLLKLQELNASIEKEFIHEPALDRSLAEQFDWILARLDSKIVGPLVDELASFFWPYTTHIENSANPKQLVILPDYTLWGFPLERCRSFDRLFDKSCRSVVSRDFSFHAAAQRVRTYVEPADSKERKPLKGEVSAFRMDTTSLLTDPFAEDSVKASDDPKTETLSMLHDRLVSTKVIGSEKRSCNGSVFVASPQDIKTMLIDSSAFVSLGFSRFFTTMPAKHFASQDLRRLAFLGLFNRCVNDPSFRRQTKVDSMKTLRQVEAENPYGTALMATFRGVQCIVMTTQPVPIALAVRSVEVFGRQLQGGKPVSKAFEELLAQQIKDPELRFLRTKEGGELPAEAQGKPTAPDGKGGGKGAEPQEQPGFDELLQMHTQAAYSLIGTPWIFGESGPEAGGKKK